MINEQKYLSRLNDTYIFIRDIVGRVDEEYILEKANSMGEGIKEIIIDPNLWMDKAVPTDDKIRNIVSEAVKAHAAKVRNYKKWVLGYGLVLMCAIFDEYLIELLENILDVNPQLTKWINKIEIMDRFEHEEKIKEKYKIFINKLNFTQEEFFDFKIFTPEIQRKYFGFDIANLVEIYKKRNKVAHTDSYVIYSIIELLNVKDLLEKMCWNLSIKCRHKWNVQSEFLEIINKHQNP